MNIDLLLIGLFLIGGGMIFGMLLFVFTIGDKIQKLQKNGSLVTKKGKYTFEPHKGNDSK